MPYSVGGAPSMSTDDGQALAKYIDQELSAIQSSMVSNVVSLPLIPIFAAPSKPRTGTIVYADGVKWNPGSGEGAYEYGSDGNWHFLQNSAPINPTYATMIGVIEFWPTTVLQVGRLKANGQSVLRATYPLLLAYLIRSGTATFTNGSSNVGMVAHKLSVGDPIKLFTTGSLPTNFSSSTHGLPTVGVNYFVKTVVDANTIMLSSTVGGSAISAGSAGSGTHTWVNTPSGDGDGSTTFTVPDYRGNFFRGWNDDASVDASRSIGDLQLDQGQGHIHNEVTGNLFVYVRGSGGIAGPGTGATWDRNSITTGGPVTDGTNGTPRMGTETRPRNLSLLVTIRYSA